MILRVTSQVEPCWIPDTHQLGKGGSLVFSAFANQVFSDSSIGKESACNAEDPSSSPGLERSSGEGIDYSLQYSWASLVT